MRTYSPKASEIERQWHVVDADGLVLGRMCTEVARLLRGKHKPTFTPHLPRHCDMSPARSTELSIDRVSPAWGLVQPRPAGRRRRGAFSRESPRSIGDLDRRIPESPDAHPCASRVSERRNARDRAPPASCARRLLPRADRRPATASGNPTIACHGTGRQASHRGRDAGGAQITRREGRSLATTRWPGCGGTAVTVLP